jgi:hypothetical protein
MSPMERRAPVSKRKGLWLAAIIVLALVLRVLYLLQARDHLFFNAFSDSIYYHRWALRILQD